MGRRVSVVDKRLLSMDGLGPIVDKVLGSTGRPVPIVDKVNLSMT